jgi:hypothetical protein
VALLPWFSANRGEGTDAAAVELVAAPGSKDFKIQSLIKLTQFF